MQFEYFIFLQRKICRKKVETLLTILASFLENLLKLYIMLCIIRYHLYNLKNVKNTHGGVLLLVRFQASASASKFFKSNIPP